MSCTIWNQWPAKAQREASYSSVLNKSCLQKDLQFTAKMYFFFFDSALTQGSMLVSSASLTEYGGYLPWCTYCGIIVLLLSVITMCLICFWSHLQGTISTTLSLMQAHFPQLEMEPTHLPTVLASWINFITTKLHFYHNAALQNYRTTLYPALWATPKISSDTTWAVHSLG